MPETSPPAVVLHVICAWCKMVLAQGSVGAPVTHDICAKCAEEFSR